jgi:hypothetical protein
MIYPPFSKYLVGLDIEALFRRQRFGEGIAHVSAINKEIVGGCNSIK